MMKIFSNKKVFTKNALLIAGIFTALTSMADHACAEFKLTDDITVSPNLYLAEEYTDNLLLTSSNQKSDFLTTIYPNIGLTYTSKYLNVHGNYGHKFILYSQNAEYDLTSYQDTLNTFATAMILPHNNFNVLLRGSAQRASFGDRYTFNEEYDLVNKTLRYDYSINPSYTYNSSNRTFQARADYLYHKTEYVDPRGNESESQQATLRIRKFLNAREDTFRAVAQAARVETDRYDGYERVHFTVGGLLHLGPYWFIEGDIGLAHIIPRDGSSFDTTFGSLFLNYGKGATHARVGYAISFPDPYDSDANRTESLEAGVVFKKRAVLGLHFRAWRDYYSNDGNQDEAMRSTFKLDVPLSKRVWMDVTADWSVYNFEPEGTTDHRYGAGFGVYRIFKWGNAGITYRYNQRDSDVASRNYASNYVRAYADISF